MNGRHLPPRAASGSSEGARTQDRRAALPGAIRESRAGCQAAALFLIAPISAVSIAPPAPPAIACEMTPPTLRFPDSAAATTEGSNNVTICPSTPPPTKPEMILPTVPRSKFGDDLPAPTPPSAPAMRLIKICSISISPMASGRRACRSAQSVKPTHSPFLGCCMGWHKSHPSIVVHSVSKRIGLPIMESINLEFLKLIEKNRQLSHVDLCQAVAAQQG